MPAPRVLVVAPPDGSDELREALDAAGCRVTAVETATAAVGRLSAEDCDCLVSAFELPGDDGLELRSAVRKLEPELPFVLYAASDAIDQSLAVDSEYDSYVARNGTESVDQLVAEVTAIQDDADAESDSDPTAEIAEADLSADELRRTVETAPIGISLCDPSQADDPLVYVNAGWEEVTGYDPAEVLDRNPRLLQGPDTDPETTARLAEAIENQESATVEIRNYRRDGTPFWNELTVAPIYDDGELLQYVGFQVDITDRRAAEARADQRADALADERRSLRRLLDRINGLLREISGVLVEATDRSEIEHGVCERIIEDQGYAASWIGRRNSGGTELQVAASSGLSAETPDAVPVAELPAAVQEAFETDDPQRCSVADCDLFEPAAVAPDRLLVVPLCYGERRYGLLGVYGAESGTLDSWDRELFAALGTMIAQALHAVETARLLRTDHVTELRIELRDGSVPLSRIAAAVGSPVERCGTTSTADGDCELYLTTAGSELDPGAVESLAGVENTRQVSETDDELTLAVTVSALLPDDVLAEFGATVTGATATADAARLTVEAPPQGNVRSLLEALESISETVELRARTDCARQEPHHHEFTGMVADQLTDRQAAVLEAAHLNDYFEYPRPVDGSEIAASMDITRQTFHQHLRAAEGKLVAAYMEAC